MAKPSVTKSRAPAFLSDLLDHTKQVLVDKGVEAEKADDISRAICSRMCNTWGGQQIYFPHGMREELSERDRSIYDEFNGFNHSDLAMKYKVSVQWVYKIVERVRLAEIATRQTTLNF